MAPKREPLPLLELFACACIACQGMGCADTAAGPVGPPEMGDWQGTDVTFHLENGAVTSLKLVGKLQCTGDDGCKGEVLPGAVSCSASVPAVGLPLTWTGTAAQGLLTLTGQFTTKSLVSGKYSAKAGACCTAVGAWSATWIPGSTPAVVAAGSTVTGKTPPQWGAASSGTWHPAQPRATVLPKLPVGVSPDQKAAAEIWEKLRAQLGVPAVLQAAPLDAAAQKHAQFYVDHKASYDKKALSPHSEDAGFGDGFGGADPSARAAAAGYSNPAVVEVMAFTGSTAAALQGWLDTVYHRLPLVNPITNEYGYGQFASAKAATEVIDAAQAGGSDADLVVYPWPGQTGVPAWWPGNEGPQPPKPPAGFPSGPVISARMAGAVEVKSHELFDSANAALPHVWLDAKTDKNLALFDAKTVVLYAHKPLVAGVYRVRLQVTRAGKDEVVQWTFTVGN